VDSGIHRFKIHIISSFLHNLKVRNHQGLTSAPDDRRTFKRSALQTLKLSIRRMKLILLFLLILVFPLQPKPEEKMMISRISYIMHLKATLGQEYWPGFNTVAGDVPLVYFTDSASYITNPTPRFMAMFRPVQIYHSAEINIYKTPERINHHPFHMSTGMDLLDTTAFNFRAPFMFCSSPETTKKVVTDLGSTEEWATMVLHEYFHGFQFRHEPMLDYYLRNVYPVTADSLHRVYKGHSWFKRLTDEENGLLLLAISSTDSTTMATYLQLFKDKRKEKRDSCREKLRIDIRKYEGYYEKLEGSARYVEYQLMNSFHTLPPDKALQKSDTFYTANKQFSDFQLEKNTWLFETTHSANYTYATGFNMTRLLDKLKRPYKEQLFTNAPLFLDSLVLQQP
jgi:hypothetical protein